MRPAEALLITITVILLLFIQLNQQQFVVFRMMYERWSNECLTVLTVFTCLWISSYRISHSLFSRCRPTLFGHPCFQAGQNSRPNLIHLAYTRRSSTEEDDELGPLSSTSSADDDADEFCEGLAWVLAVAPPGL